MNFLVHSSSLSQKSHWLVNCSPIRWPLHSSSIPFICALQIGWVENTNIKLMKDRFFTLFEYKIINKFKGTSFDEFNQHFGIIFWRIPSGPIPAANFHWNSGWGQNDVGQCLADFIADSADFVDSPIVQCPSRGGPLLHFAHPNLPSLCWHCQIAHSLECFSSWCGWY